MGNETLRKRYIDYLRVTSMLAVVLIHVCITTMTDFYDGIGTMKGVLFYGVRNILHFAVPVFFMITGALLLDPKKDISLHKLLKSYILKYLCVILTFCWAYSLIEIVFNNHDLKPLYFWQGFCDMLQGKTWAHMWYMYSLLGIMLVLPILRWIAKMADERHILYLIIVLGLFLSILPFIRNVAGFNLGVNIPINSESFLFLLLGYWIDQKKICLRKSLSGTIILGSIVLLSVTAWYQIIRGLDLDYIPSYSSPIIIVYSIAVFAIFREHEDKARLNGTSHNLKPPKIFMRGVINLLSSCSFGIYLVHMFWINLVYKFLRINPFRPNALAMMFAVWIFVVFLSVITTKILRIIPFFKFMI